MIVRVIRYIQLVDAVVGHDKTVDIHLRTIIAVDPVAQQCAEAVEDFQLRVIEIHNLADVGICLAVLSEVLAEGRENVNLLLCFVDLVFRTLHHVCVACFLGLQICFMPCDDGISLCLVEV